MAFCTLEKLWSPGTGFSMMKASQDSRTQAYLPTLIETTHHHSSNTSKVLTITSMDTHAERSTYVEVMVVKEAVSYFPPKYDKTNNEIFEVDEETTRTYATHSIGRWLHSLVDEAHSVKNMGTRNFTEIYSVQPKYNILLTATPMQNKQSVCYRFTLTSSW